MPRSEVYQLRLYPGEKERLWKLAEGGGHQSIAKLIRVTFGLDDAGGSAPSHRGPIPPKPTDLVDQIVEDVQQTDGPNPLRIKQLVAQGFTTPVATRMAKAEMEDG